MTSMSDSGRAALPCETPVRSNPLRYNSSMNVQEIISELIDQRDRIQRAIDALERTTKTTTTGKRRGRKPGRHMSADARRRIGLAMKKRWAARKRAQKKVA